MRLAQIVEGLGELGELDLFTLYDHHREIIVLPPTVSVKRLELVRYPWTARERRWRSAWLTQRGVPLELLMRSFDDSPRLSFEAWADEHYDLVWFSTVSTYYWLGRPQLGPTIVDLMDLEDVKARQRSLLLGKDVRLRSARAMIRQGLAAAQSMKNAGDWQAIQHSVAREVDRVVLCSEADVQRSEMPNAVSIPNTYARPAFAVGTEEVGEPPVLLLQGSLNYTPNMDAVDFLVEDIAPKLWTKVPGLEIRLVGKPTVGVQTRHKPPAITVVGKVPDMEPELERADLVVVPLRIGSGTRLKILESFANRIPVVATTIGADGLDVQHGVHLLIADTADDFANACHRLLSDLELRKRMVDAAQQLFLKRYEWAVAKVQLQQLAREVAGSVPSN
jgi:hypothetical protein